MCGIGGIACADMQRQPRPDVLEAMGRIIAHRGPDGHGRHLAPGIGLEFRRLSIIDPETGHQPLYNEDRTIAVVCNGEIYNYVELRRELRERGHVFETGSDAEVIAHLYEERGPECLHRLRGMFGLALWDASARRLLLARDRLGIKPMYYWTGPRGDLVFGSEIKAILASNMVDRVLDPSALQDLFSLGFVVNPKTMFKGVRQLEPGEMLLYREGSVHRTRYWDLDFPSEAAGKRGEREWAEALQAKLKETVGLHLRSDVPLGAWLSPGVDSSSVAALMLDTVRDPVTTFTLTYAEKGEADESVRCSTLDRFHPGRIQATRISCSTNQFDLLPRNLWHRESPVSSTLNLAQMLLSEASANRVKVVLAGEGADENLGGYPWYHADKLFRPFALLPRTLRLALGWGFEAVPRYRWLRRVFTAPREDCARFVRLVGLDEAGLHRRLVVPELRRDLDTAPLLRLPEAFHSWHPFQRLQYIETRTRMTDLITHGLDRASMSHSLEVRVPFLDHELVELCARIGVRHKMKGLTEKYILRRAMEAHLPGEIAWRRKCAFTAADRQWMAGSLPDFAADLLSGPTLKDKGYFDPVRVQEMLDQHRQGKRDHSRPLVAVLGVQLWDELFITKFESSARRWSRVRT